LRLQAGRIGAIGGGNVACDDGYDHGIPTSRLARGSPRRAGTVARRRATAGGPAILLLHRGEVVSVDLIVDELWGERPPGTATKTVQVYVSRLRKELGKGVLVTRGGGYVLEVDPDEVDADRFERLAGEGRDALDRGDPRGAATTLREALDLWRGPPLSDLAYESFAQNETARLEELHLVALENRVEADLGLGRHGALVSELEALVAKHPARERVRGQLMLALYRSGRQSEALESYRDAQRTLVEELGLAPGPELQQLEQSILNQDPALDAPRRAGPVAALRQRRGGALLAFGGGLLLAAAVAAILASGEDASQLAEANSLAVIDPESNRVVDTVPTGIGPADVSADADHVWVANFGDNSVTEVDPETKTVVGTTSAHTSVGGMAAGAGGVWIADSEREKLVRLDPAYPSEARPIRLPPSPLASENSPLAPVAVGHGAVWVAAAEGEIARIEPESFEVDDTIPVTTTPSSIATGIGGVWTVDDLTNTAFRIDPASANAVTGTTPVGQGPAAVAVAGGAVWVANTQDDTVTRLDPSTARVTLTIPVGSRPTGIAAGDGAVWVANSLGGTVSRIDPETNQVEATVEVGEAPQGVTIAHGQVWVSVQAGAAAPDAPSVAAAEDVARVVVPRDTGSPDPAVLFPIDYPSQFATSASLYGYPDRPFPEGIRLVPEVAAGDPLVSDHGRTYRFEIRPGFRFSPPSNEPVTAAAFERALERVLSPAMYAATPGYQLGDIVGADDYVAGRTKDLEGVSARGRTLIIRLTRPVPSLPARLAMSQFSAVPPDTPIKAGGVDLVPSAGPYYTHSYTPGRGLVLRRNPNYGGERPQGLEEIRYEFRVSAERGVEAVEAGRADYVNLQPDSSTPVLPQVAGRLAARYGPRSEAARADRQQLFTQTAPAVFSYVFNTHRGPFADPRLRRAVNYAIDRPSLAEDTGFGQTGRPTDQYIPPGFPGFADAGIYPLDGPDLAAARRLAGGERHHAVLYTCDFPGCIRNAQILRSSLDAIGIDLQVQRFPGDEMFARILRPADQAPWDLASFGWTVDYADPYNFINEAFGPPSAYPGNFRDPGLWRRMAAADRLSGDARLGAYARLDRDLAEGVAPAAPFASGTLSHFLSARMGCQVLHPLYGLDLAALCVRDDVEGE
jgi:YVTN family beta-propeller protein